MTKIGCTQIEIELRCIKTQQKEYWYNVYKCKNSRITSESTSKKRICNECKRQYKLEFK